MFCAFWRRLEFTHKRAVEVIVYSPWLPSLPSRYYIWPRCNVGCGITCKERVSLSIPRSQLLKAIRLDVQIIFLVAVENNIAVEFWSEDIIIFKRIDTEFMER